MVLQKVSFILPILGLLLLAGCKKEDSSELQFDTLEEELDYLADKYVKMGAAIGIVDTEQEVREFYFGSISSNKPISPDRHSVFEIGSITKTFTATLLAKAILDGKISLEEKLESLLPANEVSVPDWNGTPITLQHLVTHTSGLPRVPRDSNQPLPPGYDPYDPYAAYTSAHVYEYLSTYCNLLSEPGTQYSYSNTGMGILGHVLGLNAATSYEEELSGEVLESLGLNETSLFLTEKQITHLAPGHGDDLDSVKNYHANDIFQGAGFLKSSLNDMMIYLHVQMGLSESELGEALELTHEILFEVGDVSYDDREGNYHLSLGMAWHMDVLPEGHTFYWHGGRTNGYMAYMAFDPGALTGAVILCNQSKPGVIIRFGEDLLKAVNKY